MIKKQLKIRDIKKEAIILLEGKWKSVVLGLFVPFIIGILITFVPDYETYQDEGVFLFSFFESVILSFFSSVISYSFLIGVINLILGGNKKERRGDFSRILLVAIASFSRAFFPVFILKFAYQITNTFLLPDNAIVLYDILFYSYIELPAYIILTQIIRIIITFLFLYFNIVYIFTPYVLAESPFIKPEFAMKMSERITLGVKWKLIILVLSFVGWLILGAFSMFVGSFFAMAYQISAICVFYRKITGNGGDKEMKEKVHVMLRKIF